MTQSPTNQSLVEVGPMNQLNKPEEAKTAPQPLTDAAIKAQTDKVALGASWRQL
jgi:hypothetical protein